MQIGLIDVDSIIPNLALMKISAYHKQKGDNITLLHDKVISARLIDFDKVYISCIFEENREIAIKIAGQFKNSDVGGVGINHKRLPDEIEHLMPDYDLYPNVDYSINFTTRGCCRDCSFCKVRQHEGYIRVNCDIYEFWNPKHKKIVLLDNNILALPEHFMKIAGQIKENNLQVDFNQGLDHRLLTPKICKTLLDLKHIHEIRFAFDKPEYKKTVVKALNMLEKAGLKEWQSRWYVYVGVDDDFYSVYNRLKLLRKHKQGVYLMRDKRVYDIPEYIALAQWCNHMGAFKVIDFEKLEYDNKRFIHYRKSIEKYLDKEIENENTTSLCRNRWMQEALE